MAWAGQSLEGEKIRYEDTHFTQNGFRMTWELPNTIMHNIFFWDFPGTLSRSGQFPAVLVVGAISHVLGMDGRFGRELPRNQSLGKNTCKLHCLTEVGMDLSNGMVIGNATS